MDSIELEQLPWVEGNLQYLRPMAEKPASYMYDPPPGVPRHNAIYEQRRCVIRDARPIATRVTLDDLGFELGTHRSAVKSYLDEAEIREAAYAESRQIVADATGAERVVVFDHTIRRRVPGERGLHPGGRMFGGTREPVGRIHNDYTVRSGPQRVRDLLGTEADNLLKRRFAFINVWRPIRAPLLDAPLALCDAGSLAPGDLIASDLVYRDRTGETYSVVFNPAHRWFYFPQMRTDEVVLIKCYDSADDGRARFTPHCAFEDPTTPDDAPPRESIEIRTVAFFPE